MLCSKKKGEEIKKTREWWGAGDVEIALLLRVEDTNLKFHACLKKNVTMNVKTRKDATHRNARTTICGSFVSLFGMGSSQSKLEKALGTEFPEGERYYGFTNVMYFLFFFLCFTFLFCLITIHSVRQHLLLQFSTSSTLRL